MFAADRAPPGVELRFVSWWRERPIIAPRSWFTHTNGARGEGSIEAAWNWAHRSRSNTLPTYIIDRAGDAAKFLPSNRRPILTATVTSSNSQWSSLTPGQRAEITAHGNVRDWSIGAETTDTGTEADPTISAFTDPQAETLATIIAYESIVHGFPLRFLNRWWNAGAASHTDPDGWPYTTLSRGKICPGAKKKAQMRAEILPYAIQIADIWTTPPTEDDDMPKIYLAYKLGDRSQLWRGDRLRSHQLDPATQLGLEGRKFTDSRMEHYYHPVTGERLTSWGQVPELTPQQIIADLGTPQG